MKKYLALSFSVIFFVGCASNFETAAKIYESRGEYKSAVEMCQKELAARPNNVGAYLIMARCNVALGKYQEASDNIDAAYGLNAAKADVQVLGVDRDKYFTVFRTAATELIEKGKFEAALKKTDRALILDPQRGETYVIRGLIYSRLKDIAKMQESFAKALKLDPNSPEPYLYIGHKFYDETKWDSALTYYGKAIELFVKKHDNALKTIMAKTPALKPEEVGAKLVELQLAGKAKELDEYIKKVLLREGGTQEVARQLEAVANAHLSLTRAYFNAAASAYNLAKLDQAITYFEGLLKIDPTNRDGAYYYGQALVAKLQFVKAIEVFEKLVTRKVVRTLTGKGQKASETFDLGRGLATFQMKHDGEGNFAVELMNEKGKKIDLLVNEIGTFDGSKAVEIPSEGRYLLNISADGNWRISIEQDPKDKESLFTLGYAYLKTNNYDKALETLEDKYLALDTENANVYINIGLAYKGKGNMKKAYEYIKKAEEMEKRKGSK